VQLATGEPVKSKYLGHGDEVLREEDEGGEKVRQTAFEDDDDEYEV
jgi:hypothetical protein